MKKQLYFLTLFVVILLFHFQTFAQEEEFMDYLSETIEDNTPKKGVFGIDLGMGSVITKSHVFDNFNNPFILKESSPVFNIGFRYMRHVNSYISADFIKINFNCPIRAQREMKLINLQAMTGIRGDTPKLFNTIFGYAAIRMGYGIFFIDEIKHGFAFETEIGLNINHYLFIAFSYNLNNTFVDLSSYHFYNPFVPPTDEKFYSTTYNANTFALRIGFNF